MAERRMFAKTIVLSDAFLDMPMSARCLYFTWGMLADDDGFVNSPKAIMRQCGASDDDMRVLLAKKFVLAFDTGIIVIKHWRINNYLRSDRYAETKYVDEKNKLTIEPNGAYSSTNNLGIPDGTPTVYPDKDRLGKDRLGKDRLGNKYTAQNPPTLDEVRAYCNERQNGVNAEKWYAHYEANGWKVGRTPMKNWKAAVRTWEKGKAEYEEF